MTSQRDVLAAIALDDLIASFGWEGRAVLARALRWLCRNAATKFAGQMADLDEAVGCAAALSAPARQFLETRYVRGLAIAGREHIPARGPVLFVANHPGLVDNLALFAAVGRDDLMVVAERRPFLTTLTNIARHLVFVDGNLGRRAMAVQTLADHLRAGGAALTFPAGCIEPDPDIDDRAASALTRWPDITRLVARLAPATQIVPVAVRGVIAPAAAVHWLARIRRTRSERDKLAASLQLIAMVARDARPTSVSVRIGAPLALADFAAQGIDGLHRALIARMCELIVEGRTSAPSALADKADRRLDWRTVSEGVAAP